VTLLDRLLQRNTTTPISLVDWSKMFKPGVGVNYSGNHYQSFVIGQSEVPAGGYYDTNSVVFACEANRLLLFSEARFQYQQLRDGRPGDLFGTADLGVLYEPWPGATTRDLLVQAELDVAMSGNSYWVRDARGLVRIDAANVKVVTEAAIEGDMFGARVGERLLGYAVKVDEQNLALYTPLEIAHYKPYPSRTERFIGTSWLSACLPDVESDGDLTAHKQVAVKNGAQLGHIVTLDQDLTPEQFEQFVEKFNQAHLGPTNAGKTLFLGGGADVKTVGQTLENLNLRATQGAGETRIAACSGVPPVIVGLSEGLASATYSNYGQARRRLVDGTMRPLWGAFASAMQTLVPAPSGSRLWYDDRDIPFLREDVADQVQILKEQMLAIEAGVRSGFEPETVVKAVVAGDLATLQHNGLYSVQLQPPGTTAPAAPSTPDAGPEQGTDE
jgi:hypothetical protein